MTLDEVREYANILGINSVKRYTKKEDLIRTIQLREGNSDCFNQIPDCELDSCKWFADCLTKKVQMLFS